MKLLLAVLVLGGLVAVWIYGCNGAPKSGEQAIDQARATLKPAVDQLSDSAQAAYDTYSPQALAEAKAGAEKVCTELKCLPVQSVEDKLHLQEAEANLKRITSAGDMQAAKDDMSRLEDKIQQETAAAKQDLDSAENQAASAKKDLDAIEAEYRAAQSRFDDAKKSYDSATKQLHDLTTPSGSSN